jgi:hypothetical protein
MNKKLITAILMSSAFLLACSKGPSEGDAKEAFIELMTVCPLISVEKFSKANAAPVGNGNNFYDVAITYTLKAKVDPDYPKSVAAAEKENDPDAKRAMLAQAEGNAVMKCPSFVTIMGTTFTQEVTKDFTETLRMRKTDNGWAFQQ